MVNPTSPSTRPNTTAIPSKANLSILTSNRSIFTVPMVCKINLCLHLKITRISTWILCIELRRCLLTVGIRNLDLICSDIKLLIMFLLQVISTRLTKISTRGIKVSWTCLFWDRPSSCLKITCKELMISGKTAWKYTTNLAKTDNFLINGMNPSSKCNPNQEPPLKQPASSNQVSKWKEICSSTSTKQWCQLYQYTEVPIWLKKKLKTYSVPSK